MARAILSIAALLLVAAHLAADDPADGGLLVEWDARQGLAEGVVAVGSARLDENPARFELDGKGAVVGPTPLRPKRLSIEAVFRVDRVFAPGLQLIVTTCSPGKRSAKAEGNPRQWVLEIRGTPPQPAHQHRGRLSLGVFGDDERWHFALSDAKIPRGWHHAVGTFDGRAVRLHLDGVLQHTFVPDEDGRFTGSMNVPPDNVIRRPSIGTPSRHGLDGAVALARIHGRALSSDEIGRRWQDAQKMGLTFGAPVRPGAARPKAPFKVLFSNDTTNITSCTSPYHKKREPITDDRIRATVDEVAGVDVHLLQPGLGWVPWWKSPAYPAEEHYRWFQARTGLKLNAYGQYMLAGGDIVKVFVDRCREKGQHPFVSLRLNDTHHLNYVDQKHPMASCSSKFYTEHPEYRLGTNLKKGEQRVLNWAIPEVREHKFAFIKELCEHYDIDGFELDFMRFPSYFRRNETTFKQRCAIMTAFVARVRRLLDRTSKPGRRRWLCARIPCMLAAHDELGIDLPALYGAGLDIANLSAFYFTQQQTDLPVIRRLVPDMALYLEMTHCTMTGPSRGGGDSFIFLRTTDEQLYTTAHLAYERGADGVSLFNFVYYREHGTPGRGPFNEPPFHTLARLGQPKWLARQPQWYVLAKTWNRPRAQTPALPARLSKGQTHTVWLDMAPSLGTKDGLLRVMTDGDGTDLRWAIHVNGAALKSTGFVRKPLDHPYDAGMGEPAQYACSACPRSAVRNGLNEVTLRLDEGGPATVVYLDLTLP